MLAFSLLILCLQRIGEGWKNAAHRIHYLSHQEAEMYSIQSVMSLGIKSLIQCPNHPIFFFCLVPKEKMNASSHILKNIY